MGKRTDKKKIGFVYKIKEDDIFKPTLYVYGLDREKRQVYGSHVRFFAKIVAGYFLEQSGEKPGKICGLGSYENFGKVVRPLKIELRTHWEPELLERLGDRGVDVIRVSRRNDVKDAIEFHGSMYASQFEEASMQALENFIETILRDPRLGYNDIPVSMRPRS